MSTIYDKLLEKAKEAFIMSIEIYNKPTIRYRVEGFSFFICNAWELMLKAHLLNTNGNSSIYYKDNPGRTITLENCIQKIFTNNKDPLRLNLEKIIELRNTSTHFITEEYEMLYIPLFQACILNFNEKMYDFHNADMTKIIPQNFLTLAVSMKALDEESIRAKYPEEIVAKMINTNQMIVSMASENNQSFSIKIEHHHYITKDQNRATSTVYIDKNAENGVKIIKELKDPNTTHKYSAKNCIKEIAKRLHKANIHLFYNGNPVTFNMHHFTLFCNYYDLKENQKYCYTYKVTTSPTYSYSIQTIDFIVEEIRKSPDAIIGGLKEKIKNKLTSGAKEF